jgi:hypothetical protein
MPSESTETTALVGSDEASDVKVYARRWYILAVFSVLGILQVTLSHPHSVRFRTSIKYLL